jgi:ABC-type branched-subunit amino acid transport system ATPase component
MSAAGQPLLSVEGLSAGYLPGVQILHDVSVEIGAAEIVTVVGANGAGKSTLLKAVMGWVPHRGGVVRFAGHDLIAMRPYDVARLGIGYVPQLDNVFPSMTIDENLELGAGDARRPAMTRRRAEVLELFPDLQAAAHRLAGQLSGGQRQMLAMARALMARPSMVLLDEPTAGLAPEFIDRLFGQIAVIRDNGVTVLMVEQNAQRALEMSDRGYVFDLGRNRYHGPGAELLANPEIVDVYLGTIDDE